MKSTHQNGIFMLEFDLKKPTYFDYGQGVIPLPFFIDAFPKIDTNL